jgi:hypothetical protein
MQEPWTEKQLFHPIPAPYITYVTTVVTYVLTISQASSYLVATKCLTCLSTYNLLHSFAYLSTSIGKLVTYIV